MRRLLIMPALLALFSITSYGQTVGDTIRPNENRPIIDERTKQEVREGANKVEQNAKEAAKEVKEGVSNAAQEVKEEVKGATQEVKQEVRENVSNVKRNQLAWFQPGSFFAGASMGLGLGKGSGTYLSFHPRLGYFFQPGLMAGLRYGFENRLNTSYRANQFGAFLRYYPLRTKFSAFGGVGYNVGREYASNITDASRARFNSINLEIGAMLQLLPNLGGEIALENNYYDRTNSLVARNRGGRVRFAFNYYFGRANP